MLVFIEILIVLICGFVMAYVTSKTESRGAAYTFMALCFGGAITIILFLLALYISPWVQHIYVVALCLAALFKIQSYIKFVEKN